MIIMSKLTIIICVMIFIFLFTFICSVMGMLSSLLFANNVNNAKMVIARYSLGNN